jgi:carbamoyltransferase
MALISINRNPSQSDLRQFGCLWFPLFAAIFGFVLYRGGSQAFAYGLWGTAALSEVIGWFAPNAIKPFFVGSLYATFPIGWIVSHILMLVAFYLIVTPVGLLMRLFGYDPMQRKLDKSAKSYWIAREPVVNSKRYFKQY